MEERIRWMTHKGQRILRVDYSGLKGPEMMGVVKKVAAFYGGLEKKKNVCCLVDVRNAMADDAVMEEMKKLVKTTTIHYDKKGAVLGIDGVKGVLLWAVNFFTGHNLKAFADENQALDWLAE